MLPLTRENLPLPESDTRMLSRQALMELLYENRVYPDSALSVMPKELEVHLKNVVDKVGDNTQDVKEIATLITMKARFAEDLEKRYAPTMLSKPLLLMSYDARKNVLGMLENCHFPTQYLPRNILHSPLQQSRPDLCIGYPAAELTARMEVSPVFTKDQEHAIDKAGETLAPNLHFPCMTAQCRSYRGKSQQMTILQGGVDGACAVNYNHRFYEQAGIVPSVVQTCHYSITCDNNSVKLWVALARGR